MRKRSYYPFNDTILLAEFNRRKPGAFEKIFMQFHTAMCYFAIGFVGDKEAAKDLASDIFVTLWEREGHYETMDSLKSFLYISLRNACLNYQKRMRVADEHEWALIHHQTLEQPDDLIMKRMFESECLRHLNLAITVLPSQTKRVVTLMLSGMKTKEIAQMMNLSEQTVRNTKIRAIRLLRQHLSPNMLWIVAVLVTIDKMQ